MSLRTRLSIAVVAGLLAAAAAVTPAAADGDWDPSGGNGNSQQDPGGNGNRPNGGNQQDPGGGNGNRPSGGNGSNQHDPSGGNGGHHGRDDQRLYEGVVTAGTLALRSAPNRGSQIIRFAHRGDIVKIFCKVGGQTVQGNPLWYLLTDGTWAWGAARYIDNIGPAPRWC
ncbi:SH3 domain-containing protein [Streptomyces sp. NPDC056373]|uniref:SH3 domain-containing protein n=1 Tax=Streptomyces sp. NPDC056373 TaxID=3345798 RepID=UPI0035E02376